MADEPFFPSPAIEANPTAYRFTVPEGYKFLGNMPMPSPRAAAASACEPPAGTLRGSWHKLKPPGQPEGIYIAARWNPEKKLWIPAIETQGKRLAFSSAYMAAAGWVYDGVVDA